LVVIATPRAPVCHAPASAVLQFPGLTLQVQADDGQCLTGNFRDILGQFVVSHGSPNVTLNVRSGAYTVRDRTGTSLSATAMELDEPGVTLADAALQTYIGCCADYLLLHAAGLERDGRVVLLAAPSTHGKTTLTLALLASGWRFLSDEIVPVRLDDCRAAPFPRATHIRHPSLDSIEQQGFGPALSQAVRLLHEDRQRVLGIPVHQVPVACRLDVAAVVFPTYTPGVQATPVRIAPALAASRLLEQALNGGTLGRQAFASAIALARRVPSYRLSVDTLGKAVTVVEALTP
jgi:hypothetical protein